MSTYAEFLATKRVVDAPTGLADVPDLNPMLFPFQHDITRWALRRGRAAIFADCGLGKTPMQLEWARHVPGPVLIVAPLAVSRQTIREGEKFGVHVRRAVDQGSVDLGACNIWITNYERLHGFDPAAWHGLVLDESSILKSYSGKYRTALVEEWGNIPFRLACTATPAPNDYMELGNHAEFLGVMTRVEMLAMFFVHDGGDTQKWRLKGHAEAVFWKWLCSWAVMLRAPSDLGYEDGEFVLPPLEIHEHVVTSDAQDGWLFPVEARSLQERIGARRDTIEDRVSKCAELINGDKSQWLVWCNLNNESDALAKALKGAVQVQGSDKDEHKETALLGFGTGDINRLVTKPSIAGFGMNWQRCHNVAFVGLSDSYEQYYQAVRRCWRFGQTKPVQCHIITADVEGAVVANIRRKERDAARMAANMVEHMCEINAANIRETKRDKATYKTSEASGTGWRVVLGDCVECVGRIADGCIGYSIFSPPFSSLYTYSNSERDMGNSTGDSEFFAHFSFLVAELFRVLQPGRLLSFHCMNIPTSKVRDGYIGMRDFRGDLIRAFQAVGFVYHSEVCIWKNPVTAMQRTKAKGLLHKQIAKDSTCCRQGIPDYLVTMAKPGENQEPVSGELDHFQGDQSTFQNTGRLSIDIWQRYASPVWMDINPSNTLQKTSAREHNDERHICPLQLDVIHRALQLWTNPGDLVLSPFAGIGSEGFEAVKMGRRFIGVELKESYYTQAVKNMHRAEQEAHAGDLFTAEVAQ